MKLNAYLNVWRTAMQEPCGYSHIVAVDIESALRLTEDLPGQECASVYPIVDGGAPLRYAEHAIVDLKLPYHGVDIALPPATDGYEWWGVLQEDRPAYLPGQIRVRRFAFCQARRYRDLDALADNYWPLANHEHGPALVYDMAAITHNLKAWRAPIETFDATFPTRVGHLTHMDDEGHL